MLKKIIVILSLLLVILKTDLICQTENSSINLDRRLSAYIGIGFVSIFSIGSDYKINDKFAIGMKYDYFPHSNSMKFSSGLGAKVKYIFTNEKLAHSIFLFNTINLEYSTTVGAKKDSNLIFLGIGKEKTGYFFWNFGVSFVTKKNTDPWILPYLKFGYYF